MSTPNTETQAAPAAKPLDPKRLIKLEAVTELRIPEKFFTKDANPMDIREIKPGTKFSVPADYAEGLIKPIRGYPKFRGERDEESAEYNEHYRAKVVSE